MPHLANISGASTVADLGPFNRRLDNMFAQRREEEQFQAQQEQELLRQEEEQALLEQLLGQGGLPGQPGQIPGQGQIPGAISEAGAIGTRPPKLSARENAATARLLVLNPQGLKGVQQIIATRDLNAIKAFEKETESRTRTAVRLKGLKPGIELQKGITQEIAQRQAAGQDFSKLVELANLSGDAQQLMLDKRIMASIDASELAKSALKSQEREEFTLSEGQVRFDAQGRPLASVPKKPTKTSLIRNLESVGIDPNSPEGRDIVVKSLTKPGVKIDLSEGLDFKLPPGFMLLDKNDPTKGVTPIPGGPKDNLSSENAAKTQMIQTARKASIDVEDLIFDEDGSLNRTNLFNAGFNTAFTDGRKLRNKMEFGIQAITRLETGAAMPPEEVENTRTRFMPQLGDTVEIAKLKLQMYNEFLNGSLKLIDPSSRFDAERFDAELGARAGGQAIETGGPQEGATATNPATGERIIFTGGQWQVQ